MLLLELAVVTVTPPLETFWAADTLYCLPPLIVVILRLLLMTVGPLTELGTGTRLICWLELSRVMLLWSPPTEPTRLPPTVGSKVKVRNWFNLQIFQLTIYLVMESKHLTPLTQNSATIRYFNWIHTSKTQYLNDSSQYSFKGMKFQSYTMVTINFVVTTMCSLEYGYQSYEGTECSHLQGVKLLTPKH